jgi:hypothetical protein
MRRWTKRSTVLALAAILFAFSCDMGPGADSPVSPPAESGDLFGLPGLRPVRPTPPPSGLVWIEETPSKEGFVSGLIGLLGGVLRLDGHSLDVPRGAVLQLTLFTMATPSTPVVDVDLNAIGGELVGGLLSRLGVFRRPVRVEMSYARAKNVTDPDDLVIVRMLPGGRYQVIPTTVDKRRKVIWAELEHFSKYAMASN